MEVFSFLGFGIICAFSSLRNTLKAKNQEIQALKNTNSRLEGIITDLYSDYQEDLTLFKRENHFEDIVKKR